MSSVFIDSLVVIVLPCDVLVLVGENPSSQLVVMTGFALFLGIRIVVLASYCSRAGLVL